jgi:hypothetical protein
MEQNHDGMLRFSMSSKGSSSDRSSKSSSISSDFEGGVDIYLHKSSQLQSKQSVDARSVKSCASNDEKADKARESSNDNLFKLIPNEISPQVILANAEGVLGVNHQYSSHRTESVKTLAVQPNESSVGSGVVVSRASNEIVAAVLSQSMHTASQHFLARTADQDEIPVKVPVFDLEALQDTISVFVDSMMGQVMSAIADHILVEADRVRSVSQHTTQDNSASPPSTKETEEGK